MPVIAAVPRQYALVDRADAQLLAPAMAFVLIDVLA